MPLVRIDTAKGRSPETMRSILDALHRAVVSSYGIPERDRFQVVTEHEPGQIVAQDAGLGFERTDPLIIQIFTQGGRSNDAKQQLYANITDRLAEVGVPGTDVFISYIENGPQDWSFGFGRAQYLTGDLSAPQST